MSTLALWKFVSTQDAARSGEALRDLPDHLRAGIQGAVCLSWEVGARRPSTTPLTGLGSGEAFDESFWGVLFGLVFFTPLLGAAMERAPATKSGSLAEVGIDDIFVHRVRDAIAPGTSGLFLLGSDKVLDQVRDALRVHEQPDLVHVVHLSRRHEGALRDVFAR